MAISGHKNEASIRSYSSNVSKEQRRNTSNAMALSIADSHNDGNADGDDCSPTGMYKSPQPSTRLDLLQDMDIPPTQSSDEYSIFPHNDLLSRHLPI